MNVTLRMPEKLFQGIRNYLLPKDARIEEAGFVFAHSEQVSITSTVLNYVEWMPLRRRDFYHQSSNHLELRDETRARLIKRAHDLNCSIVEFHSHPAPWPAQFSGSDFRGFAEFVPHVWWRLKGRPYAAIVMAPDGFDGLSWIVSPNECHELTVVDLGSRKVFPTGLSIKAAKNGAAWNV